MSNRFARPDARADLFSTYNRSTSPSKSKSTKLKSPYAAASYAYSSAETNGSAAFGAYPGSSVQSAGGLYPGGSAYGGGSSSSSSSLGAGGSLGGGGGGGGGAGGGMGGNEFRSATPNLRGQYSAAVLDELESQNDNEHVGILTGKVKQLKALTHLIGDEIRDSTALAEKMNDQFENSRNRLRGTMNRMLRMAQKTGVGWRVWVGFFAAVILLFWWVWLS